MSDYHINVLYSDDDGSYVADIPDPNGPVPSVAHSRLRRAKNHPKSLSTERAGFEPAMEFNPHTRLAGECLQPLGHLSSRLEASVASVRCEHQSAGASAAGTDAAR
jgi:hypothetical protein